MLSANKQRRRAQASFCQVWALYQLAENICEENMDASCAGRKAIQ